MAHLDKDDKTDPLVEDVVLLPVEVGVVGPDAGGNLSIMAKCFEMLQFLSSWWPPLQSYIIKTM